MEIKTFNDLGMSKRLLKIIEDLEFLYPTEIQEKTIPIILDGKDVIGKSATGSGKTLAFGVGAVENSKKGEGIQTLILTPTRELAEQISQNLKKFARDSELKIIEVYGGVSFSNQEEKLKKSEIVVGTPGRILDHIRRGTIELGKIKILVLDEADRMLEMGFIDDVVSIIERCPEKRQTLLFSATISGDIERIGRKYMEKPIYVEAKNYVDPSKLKQVYYDTPPNLKFSLLVHLLKKEEKGFVMVFCGTRKNVDLVVKNLKRHGVDALAIHGGLSQSRRNKTLESFHSQKALILVCTDVAARGLDIKDISHVYNYDIPANSTEYIHRVGRTARAGKEGIAISIVCKRDYDNFRNVREDDSLKMTELEVPEVEQLEADFRTNLKYGEKDRFGRRIGGDKRKFSSSSRRDSRRPRRDDNRDSRKSDDKKFDKKSWNSPLKKSRTRERYERKHQDTKQDKENTKRKDRESFRTKFKSRKPNFSNRNRDSKGKRI